MYYCVSVRNTHFVFWTPYLIVPLSARCQRVCGVYGSDCMIWPKIPAHFVLMLWLDLDSVKNESSFDPVSLCMCILTGFDALVSHPEVIMTASNSIPSGIVSSDVWIIIYLFYHPLLLHTVLWPSTCHLLRGKNGKPNKLKVWFIGRACLEPTP